MAPTTRPVAYASRDRWGFHDGKKIGEAVRVVMMPITAAHGHEGRKFFAATLASGLDVFFGVEPGYDWIDVYAPKRVRGQPDAIGRYEVFGYGLTAKRYTHRSVPRDREEIACIAALLPPSP